MRKKSYILVHNSHLTFIKNNVITVIILQFIQSFTENLVSHANNFINKGQLLHNIRSNFCEEKIDQYLLHGDNITLINGRSVDSTC